ncbi:MAG: LCP family protein [bacterium]|nr:LCP family protein [bacterium]
MPQSNQHQLHESPPEDYNPRESRSVLIFLSIALVFLIVSASLGGILFASSAGIKPNTIIAKLRTLTLSREKMLQGESEDRINILLLGMGGVGHEGATLTDTIIVASARPSDKKIALLSIPRDLQVNIPGYGYRRINSANAYAESNQSGSGSSAAATVITKITAQPIHYFVRLDFTAFKEIIDSLDGIEVDVDKAFYDPFYPDADFGYAPVSFESGKQTMNGERALKFARSRHGTNGEGSDFARARRGQKVLVALRERLLSFDVLLRPKRIKSILESLDSHIQTNISFWEGMRMANLFKDADTNLIVNRVLDASPEGMLVERNYNGAFVLEPKTGNWDAISKVAAGIFDAAPSPIPSLRGVPPTPADGADDAAISTPKKIASPPKPEAQSDISSYPIIEIQNGTTIAGLAAKTAQKLELVGFNTSTIGNGSIRDVKTTIVYDLTGGKKLDAFTKLKGVLKAISGEGEPTHLISKGTLDFVVILGQNATQ